MTVRHVLVVISLALAGALVAGCGSEKAADGGAAATGGEVAGAPVEPGAQDAAQGATAAGSQVPDAVTVAAILLFDNRTRCMRVAGQGASIIQAWSELNPGRTPPGFAVQLRSETGDDLPMSQVVDEEVSRLYRELRGRRDLWRSSSLEAISGMYRAQSNLCGQVIRPAISVGAYEAPVRAQVQAFDQAAARLEMEYRPAAGERDYVARKYDPWFRNLLVAGKSRPAGSSTVGFDSDVPEPTAPISADEYRRRQQEWREHEKLLEERHRAREEARRAAIDGWRGKDDPQPIAPPRVGMTTPGHEPGAEPPSQRQTTRTLARKPPLPSPELVQMQAWHRGYLVGVNDVKQALASYIEAREAGDAAARAEACGVIETECTRLLDDRFLLHPPDDAVGKALRSAFRGFRATARHCRAGRAAEEAQAFAAADAALARAGQALGGYGLAP